jgi:hypothetical protein
MVSGKVASSGVGAISTARKFAAITTAGVADIARGCARNRRQILSDRSMYCFTNKAASRNTMIVTIRLCDN